jgi:hypothetical protein
MSKEAVADAVRRLPAEQQVDLLAQALLREYMHRKGYHKTLAKFDEENPRGETTISSRQLMHSLMAIDNSLAPRNKLRAKPFGTIMELLCSYRIRKRAIRKIDDSSKRGAAAGRPEGFVSDSSDEERELQRVADEKRNQIAQVEAEIARLTSARAERAAETATEKKKKKKKSGDADEAQETKKKKKDKTDAPAAKVVDADSSASSGKRKQMFALQNAMNTVANLPTGSSQRYGAGSGHNWTPGGSSAAFTVPDIGLNASTAAQEGGAGINRVNEKPPCFLAGMALMADRIVIADPHQTLDMNISGKGLSAPLSSANFSPSRAAQGGPAGQRMNPSHDPAEESGDSAVPSPYRGLGSAPYDPNLRAKGVIRNTPAGQGESPNAASGRPLFQLRSGGSRGSPSHESSATDSRKGRRVTILEE